MKLSFSPKSKQDLLDIALYIAAENPKKAFEFVAELEAACDKLKDFPLIGIERPEVAKGSRMLVHKKYLIFYCVSEGEVTVEHFMRGDRDIEKVFEPIKEKLARLPRGEFTKPKGSKEK